MVPCRTRQAEVMKTCISIISVKLFPNTSVSSKQKEKLSHKRPLFMLSIHKSTYTQPEWIPSWDRAYVSKASRQQCWPGKHSTVLCSMLAAAENTHGPEQIAAEEGDRLKDENCWGYPTWDSVRQRLRERERANLTLSSVRLQRGFRRNLLLLFSDIHLRMKVIIV